MPRLHFYLLLYSAAVKELILRYPVFALCEPRTDTVNVPSIAFPTEILDASNPETI